MRRREFIVLLVGASAFSPFIVHAQRTDRVRLVGVLAGLAADHPEAQPHVAAFELGLRQLGWIKDQNIRLEYRFGGGDADRMRHYAAELVALLPDVILASSAAALLPLQQATDKIPIVFVSIYDPVATGFVPNLTRPNGNITGFSLGEFSLGGKMLDILKKLVPTMHHTGIIYNPEQSPHVAMLHSVEAVAPTLGVRTTALPLRKAAEIESVIEAAAGERNDGLVLLPSSLTFSYRERITCPSSEFLRQLAS